MPNVIHNIELLNPEVKELLDAAQKVSFKAYNKYSKFYVGAAVRTISGNMYLGTYLDNASSGLTICAEPAAIMAANTNSDFRIESIAIVGGPMDRKSNNPITPCGRCRQIIFEASLVSSRNIAIYCSDLNFSNILITNIEELLPLAFMRDDL